MTEEKKNESEGPAAKPEMNHRNENFRGAGGRGGRFNRFGGPRHQRDREDRPRPLDQVNFHVTHCHILSLPSFTCISPCATVWRIRPLLSN